MYKRQLVDTLQREDLGSPAIIVVGDVVKGVAAAAQSPQLSQSLGLTGDDASADPARSHG